MVSKLASATDKLLTRLIELIPEDNETLKCTDKLLSSYVQMRDHLVSLDHDVKPEIGDAVKGVQTSSDNYISCALCDGHYSLCNKSKHYKSKKHLTEEAKRYGYYDFTNATILRPFLNNVTTPTDIKEQRD